MIKAVLFDMDGLMFDTENVSDRAWKKLGVETGLYITDSFLKSLKGRTRRDCSVLMKKQWGETADLDEIRKQYYSHFEMDIKNNGIPVKKGLRLLMEYLKINNYVTGLATSTEQKRADRYLDESGMDSYFHVKIYGNQVVNGKPEPDIYLKCAKACGFRPEECLVLEDSPSGITAGYKAGCHVVMIPDCIPPEERERKMIDCILPDLGCVMGYLSERNELQSHICESKC